MASGIAKSLLPLKPFEMHPPYSQRLLLTVAGTSIRMLCEGQVVKPEPYEPCCLHPARPRPSGFQTFL